MHPLGDGTGPAEEVQQRRSDLVTSPPKAVSWLAAPSSAGAAHKRCPLSAGRVVVLVARSWSHGSRPHAAHRGRRAGAVRSE